jgi:uncharacterized protein (DUF427 family)
MTSLTLDLAGTPEARLKEQAMEPKAATVKVPGPDHPITITPTKGRVTVTVNGERVADTREALTLKEAAYSAVQYIPRRDVDMRQLQRTSHRTYCPYKGECAYYSIAAGGERSVNAVWTYEAPYAAVSAIREYLAFYPDRVDAIEVGVDGART